jgi:hypothetical protein
MVLRDWFAQGGRCVTEVHKRLISLVLEYTDSHVDAH